MLNPVLVSLLALMSGFMTDATLHKSGVVDRVSTSATNNLLSLAECAGAAGSCLCVDENLCLLIVDNECSGIYN